MKTVRQRGLSFYDIEDCPFTKKMIALLRQIRLPYYDKEDCQITTKRIANLRNKHLVALERPLNYQNMVLCGVYVCYLMEAVILHYIIHNF
jgi:hypothetical protein